MTLFILLLAGFVAWFVSTLAGGGAALLLLPVVHLLIGAQAVAPVVSVSTLIALPERAYLMREHINWDIVRWFLPGAVIGALLGALVFANTEVEWLQIIIGLFLMSTLFQYRFGDRQKSFPMKLPGFMPLGFATSFVSGIVGGAGPVLNPFYLNYGAVKDEMVATRAFNGMIMTAVKIIAYAGFGAMTWQYLLYGVVIGAAALVANYLGRDALHKLKIKHFRQIVVGIMVIAGAFLFLDGVDVLQEKGQE